MQLFMMGESQPSEQSHGSTSPAAGPAARHGAVQQTGNAAPEPQGAPSWLKQLPMQNEFSQAQIKDGGAQSLAGGAEQHTPALRQHRSTLPAARGEESAGTGTGQAGGH